MPMIAKSGGRICLTEEQQEEHSGVDSRARIAKLTPKPPSGLLMSFPRLSRGFSMGGFVLLLVVVLLVSLLAMKIVPMYMEFNSVKSAMQAISSEKFDSTKAVRDALVKRMSVNYVESVGRDDIIVTPSDGSYVVSVDYYVDKPLVANLSISGHFEYEVTTSK